MKNDIKYFKWLIRVLFLFVILVNIESEFKVNLAILRYILIFFGTFIIIFKQLKIPTKNKVYKGFIRIVNFVYLFFVCFSILNGSSEVIKPQGDFLNLKLYIGNYALLYSIPFLLFINPSPQKWKYFIKYSYLLLIVLIPFLILDLLPYLSRSKSPEGIIRAFAGTSGFLLLISPFLSSFKRKVVLNIFLVSLVILMLHARRNMVLYFGLFYFFYFILLFFTNGYLVKAIRVKIIFNTFILILIASFLYIVINPDFSLLIEKSTTGMDSRVDVIEEFSQDLIPFSSDFFLGKGMYGRFYSYYLGDKEDNGLRSLIENGYLQLILNFGFIFLFCFVIISITGFIKGFFYSENLYVKACASVLIINLIDMIGYGVPEISFRYFLIIFCVPFCFSVEFRNYTDLEIKKLIFT